MKTQRSKAVDLTKALTPYSSGWVAIDKNFNVVNHAKDFTSICKAISKRRDLLLVPASKNYFGFITIINGKISLFYSKS